MLVYDFKWIRLRKKDAKSSRSITFKTSGWPRNYDAAAIFLIAVPELIPSSTSDSSFLLVYTVGHSR